MGNFYNLTEPLGMGRRSARMKKFLIVFVLALSVAGCGQIYEKDPVGIGFGQDELKLSPCACMIVYNG
jgi:hypothetical protein